MKSYVRSLLITIAFVAAGILAWTGSQMTSAQMQTAHPKETEHSFDAPNNMKLSVKMLAPYAAPTDVQIICVFKHNPAGDKYISSMKTLDDKLGGLLSSLRNRGEFDGELGETILLNVPKGAITPPRLLVIGLGPEKDLSLDALRIVGRVALREAVRLKAKHVAFAPTIRDQGNSVLDVGDVDRAVVEQVILAYDTEKRLQSQGLADSFDIQEWIIEAGQAYVDAAIDQAGKAVETASAQVRSRSGEPLRHNTK
jgi:Cytosol aminopeptidase family, N-terminal domain